MAILPIGHPLSGVLVVLLLLAALLGGVRLVQRRGILHPEHARKCFHVGAGLLVLSFPWLFDSLWPVLALAGLTIPVLLALKYVPALRGGLGGVLYAVNRGSLGEVCFPLAALTLYALSAHNTLLYAIPLLILTLADSSAALVGGPLGRHRFQRVAREKSLEGSFTFLIVAWLSALLPLWGCAAYSPGVAVLAALAVALLLTPVEAISPYGLDNLTVPVMGYLLLRLSLALDTRGLAVLLASAVLLACLCYRWLLQSPSRTALVHSHAAECAIGARPPDRSRGPVPCDLSRRPKPNQSEPSKTALAHGAPPFNCGHFEPGAVHHPASDRSQIMRRVSR